MFDIQLLEYAIPPLLIHNSVCQDIVDPSLWNNIKLSFLSNLIKHAIGTRWRIIVSTTFDISGMMVEAPVSELLQLLNESFCQI